MLPTSVHKPDKGQLWLILPCCCWEAVLGSLRIENTSGEAPRLENDADKMTFQSLYYAFE